jgi:hypothetical protein
MEWGLAKGLAVDLQYDKRIQDARWQDQQMKRAQAENMAELKAFEDDMDYMNAANSFDHELIKSEANKTIREIGEIIRNNPDFRVNPDVRRQINEKKKYLKSNQNVIRGMASDKAYADYIKDMQEVARNPEFHDTEAYQNIQNQWKNYTTYGHQDGKEAAEKFGPQAFVYSKPRDFRDLTKDFGDIGNSFKDVLQKPIKGGGQGSYQEYANPATLKVMAEQYYSQNQRQVDIQAKKYNMNPLEYVMNGIDANIKKQRHLGDFSLQNALALRAYDERNAKKKASGTGKDSGGFSTWESEIKGKDYGIENGEVFDKVFGKENPYSVHGKNGKEIKIEGFESRHTGNHRYMEVVGKDGRKHKQKFVEVYTDIPKETSRKLGFTYDPWGIGDNDIHSDFDEQVSKYTVQDKDGKSHEITRVKGWVPVDVNNHSFRGRYDQMNMPDKMYTNPTPEQDYTGWTQDKTTGKVYNADGVEMVKGKDY